MLLNNQWITKEIKEEITIPRVKWNKKITIQNVQDEAIAVQRGKFIDKTLP